MIPANGLPRRWLAAWGLAAIVLLVFILANAHLIAVSMTSQPACVEQLASEDGAAHYRAATPSC